MTRNDENPALGGASVHALRPGSRHSDSTADTVAQPQKIKISEQGATFIEGISNGLAAGDLELWQLPLPIASLYLLGYEQGRASQHERIENYAFLLEAYRWDTENPRRRVGDWMRTRLIEAERELWRQGVAA